MTEPNPLCPPPDLALPVPGVRIATAAAGIKNADRDDMAVLLLAPGSRCAGVFTRSHFAAAPVQLCRELLGGQQPVAALVVNSGNANAATGKPGRADAEQVCAAAREAFAVDGAVLPFSTGVIGERLPVEKMCAALGSAAKDSAADRWLEAAQAIMTTDTVPKLVTRQLQLDGETVTIAGIAKGSGMIKPDMATMLAYLACDAPVAQPLLDQWAAGIADRSFNRVIIDGDTSTNDAFMLVATGQASLAEVGAESDPNAEALLDALTAVAVELAQRIARDGEGATRFVTVTTTGARNDADALAVSQTIAESPLVKTALFAGDANWGRLCMAIGRAPAEVDPDRVSLHLGAHCIAQGGLVASSYDETEATRIMAAPEIVIHCDLGLADGQDRVWTSDLSYDYVRINAEYRT